MQYDTPTFIRIIICTAFVGAWIIWIINSPNAQEKELKTSSLQLSKKISPKNKTTIIKPKEKINNEVQKEIKEEEEEEQNKTTITTVDKKSKPPNTRNKPTPVVVKEIKAEQKKQNTIDKKEEKPLIISKSEKSNSSEGIGTDNKSTLTVVNTTTTNTNPVQLRDKITIDLNKQKLLLDKYKDTVKKDALDSFFEKSWVPAYIQKRDELVTKSKEANETLDDFINKIELVGLITNSQGEKVAVIKNNNNNKVNLLTKGDELSGLKLLNLDNEQITLWNESLNKTYIKKLIVIKQAIH